MAESFDTESIDTESSNSIFGDYSVYMTIMNKTSQSFDICSQNNSYGNFNPVTVAPLIQPQGQVFFSLEGDLWTGSKGLVTYDDAFGKRFTFAFQCPQVSKNDLSVPLNQTDLNITYYGINQPIQWDPNGGNWGPANNFPNKGHPLYALFVIDSK